MPANKVLVDKSIVFLSYSKILLAVGIYASPLESHVFRFYKCAISVNVLIYPSQMQVASLGGSKPLYHFICGSVSSGHFYVCAIAVNIVTSFY